MMKSRWVRIFLLLTALEGFVALVVFFSALESRSRLQMALGGLAAVVEIGLVLLTAAVFLWSRRLERAGHRLAEWMDQHNRRLVLFIILLFLAGIIAGLVWLYTRPAAFDYSQYEPLFKGGTGRFETTRNSYASARPLLGWGVLGLLQLAVLVVVTGAVGFKEMWKPNVAGKTILVLLLAAATLAHWVILRFQIRVFANIPGWYWEVGPHRITGSPWILAALAALSVGLVVLLMRRPGRVAINLLLVILLGYLLQVGFGFLDGRGYEYVRLKYAGTLHKSYAMRASTASANALKAVRDYETLYGNSMFPSTKPPGVMVFYILTGKLVNAVNPQPTTEARFEALTRFEAIVFPLISFLVVIVIYRLARRFLDERSAYLPAVLYLFAANILLLPLFLDQVLYPLLFSLGVLLTLRAVERGGFWPGVWLGISLYLAVFFSFSLLPLAAFSLLYIALQAFLRRKERPVLAQARVVMGVAAGAGLLFAIFWLALNYDFITRYRHAMAVVHYYDYFVRTGAAESGAFTRGFFPSLAERAGALLLNNLDFGAAAGFPLYLLFLVGGVRSIVELLRGKLQPGELLLPVYFLTFLALNLYGQNRGESARLWMFWMPAVVLLAGRELVRLFRRPGRAAVVLVIAQLITVYLTFRFQDFWM